MGCSAWVPETHDVVFKGDEYVLKGITDIEVHNKIEKGELI
jgi:hypothetical protein